jgi:hypothetical protein
MESSAALGKLIRPNRSRLLDASPNDRMHQPRPASWAMPVLPRHLDNASVSFPPAWWDKFKANYTNLD